ncbi:L-iditol 2-dehydrogenase [Mycolicibacterium iranicum]|uniref:L-iditol 2-dehydrogenase n=1 Tax=Mycolicibacterium iranicum TaxID=912594 RepID=A0A839QBX9_MYCIR|nr:zinc-dependent dehydrogenase [Mycolicibacterium iranicum]MBB2993639.1 L-iditol 2-dehydrogenase [Mycolicibacterium iranicum]
MKALRFYAPEDVRLEDVAEPDCAPDEVKLRVRNCSTCGTDVKIFYNGHQNLTPPRTIGHEIAGEIVEVGGDVNATYGSNWQVGDRVQVIAAVPCGECHECRKGWMAVCQNQTSMGYQYDGGFAEYMIVPRQVLKVDGLNRIPDNVGFDEASAAEPFACAINAQELLGIEEGDTVVVFGAGPIGCMHIRIARGVHKCGPIYLVDVNDARLKMSADAVHPDGVINAAEVDVVEKVMELTGGRGADIVITATAANIAQEQAISMAARNGRISFFGGLPKTDPTITCDSNLVHYRQLHIHGANGSAPEHNKRALEYISTGQVPVKDLITRHIPLDDVLDAFQIVKKGEAIKVTVEPTPADVPAGV